MNPIPEVADSNPSELLPPPPANPAKFSVKRAYFHTFSATVCVRILGAISGVLAARLLGPVGRGELAIITLLPTMLLPLGELELPRALAYSVSKAGTATAKTVSSGLWLALAMGTVQMLALAAVVGFFLSADKLYLLHDSRLFTIYLPLVFLLTCAMGIEQGKANFGRFSLLQVAPGLIYVLSISVGYFFNLLSPSAFAFGILAGAAIPAIIQSASQWNAVGRVRPDSATSLALLSRGLTFYVPALAALALSRADTFMLVRLVGVKEVGLYIVAQAIAVGQMGSISPFVQVGFTAVASESETGKPLLTLARHFRLAQLAVLAAGLLTIALTPFILKFAFGADFHGAVYTTYILIAATMFGGLGQLLDQGLRAAGHSTAGTICNLLGFVVLCIFGVQGAGRFGILGLSSAVLLGYLTTALGLLMFCIFRLGMSPGLFWAFQRSTVSEITSVVKARLVFTPSINEQNRNR